MFHLENGILVKWHETKTESIRSYARSMLAGVSDPGGMNQLDNETNMTIPTDLAIMERRNNSTKDYNIVLMTRRIANIVADVQQEKDRHYS
jgi:hypothetical protein